MFREFEESLLRYLCFISLVVRKWKLNTKVKILVTRLDESWTHHCQLGLTKILQILDFYYGGTQQNFQK